MLYGIRDDYNVDISVGRHYHPVPVNIEDVFLMIYDIYGNPAITGPLWKLPRREHDIFYEDGMCYGEKDYVNFLGLTEKDVAREFNGNGSWWFSEKTSQRTREMIFIRRFAQSNNEKAHAFARLCNIMLPADVYRPNHWADIMALSFWDDVLTCHTGPASVGKTSMMAYHAVCYWLLSPHNTYVACCSTTESVMLEKIWGEINRWWGALCEHSPEMAVFAKNTTSPAKISFIGLPGVKMPRGYDPKACLKGAAIANGTWQKAKGRVIGVHVPFIKLLIDEMQTDPRMLTLWEARSNLRKATKEFFVKATGNPTDRGDPLGSVMKPTAGWDVLRRSEMEFECVNKATERRLKARGIKPTREMVVETRVVPEPVEEFWFNEHGSTYFFNGFHAPSLDSPEEAERLGFLQQRSDLEEDLWDRGVKHIDFWTYTLGFMPPRSAKNMLFTSSFLEANLLQADGITWLRPPNRFAAVDPAHGTGGDRFTYKMFEVGYDVNGVLVVKFHESEEVEEEVPEDEDDLEFYDWVGIQVARKLIRDMVPIEHVVYDTTGNQMIYPIRTEKYYARLRGYEQDTEFRNTIYRYSSTGAALDTVIDIHDSRSCKELHLNARTTAYFALFSAISHQHVCGISALEQVQLNHVLIKSKYTEELKNKYSLVDKRDIKQALGRSPDDTDCISMGMLLLRDRYGFIPGDHTSLTDESVFEILSDESFYEGDELVEYEEWSFSTQDTFYAR